MFLCDLTNLMLSYFRRCKVESFTFRSTEWISVLPLLSTETSDFFKLENLTPKTQYSFRLKLVFTNLSSPYVWPADYRFTFETLGW